MRKIFSLSVAIFLVGCVGYTLGPIPPTFMKGIHRIAVPIFRNTTVTADVETLATTTVIKQIQQDGTYEVTGVDPARASLDVARGKPGAERVRWIDGDATRLPLLRVDLVTMTGNVAQVIIDEASWHGTLRGAREALLPGGHLVFETRNPEYRAWQEWNRANSWRVTEIAGVGAVESWVDLLQVRRPLVSFRWTYVFPDGEVLTSDSTLRFREREEVEEVLLAEGYVLADVRDAPDRPGREFVFLARRA